MKKVIRQVAVIIMTLYMCSSDLYLPGISFATVYTLVQVLLSFLLVFYYARLDIVRIPKNIKRFALLFLGSLLTISISFLVNGADGTKEVLSIILCSFFGMSILTIIDTKDDIVWLYNSYLIVVVISSVVCIGQGFGISFFYDVWYLLNKGNKIESALLNHRLVGLAPDILSLGYQLSVAFAIVVFKKFRRRIVKISLIIIILTATIINNTRSSIIAILFTIVFFLFSSAKGKIGIVSKILSLTVLFLFVIVSDSGLLSFLRSTRISSLDNSALARIPMMLTAFNHGFHYPLGMGGYHVDVDLVVGTTNSIIIDYVCSNSAHNLLGNCIAFYGVFTFFLLLLMYKNVFKAFSYSSLQKTRRHTEEYKASFVCVIALFINSFFHNSYLFTGELLTFLFMFICISVYKVYDNQ